MMFEVTISFTVETDDYPSVSTKPEDVKVLVGEMMAGDADWPEGQKEIKVKRLG